MRGKVAKILFSLLLLVHGFVWANGHNAEMALYKVGENHGTTMEDLVQRLQQLELAVGQLQELLVKLDISGTKAQAPQQLYTCSLQTNFGKYTAEAPSKQEAMDKASDECLQSNSRTTCGLTPECKVVEPAPSAE